VFYRNDQPDQREETGQLGSLDVLAGGIAHDFNNILTAILGNISLDHIQVHDPEKAAQRLKDAENAAARASTKWKK
jgi:two-component system, cell cycle sensor histidine kinase and response regulator CckA